jgi:hypothetical protein
VVRYDGVPRTQQIILPGFTLEAGFIHTDDGAVIAGEPEVAANWFPVNDHPIDKAAYTFVVTVPVGLEVVGNGRLVAHRTRGRSTTWVWNAPEPMASYLATATIGQFDLRTYRTPDGLRMYDALDPDLFTEPANPDDPASPTFGEIAQGSLARQGEILDLPHQPVRALPVLHRRGARRRLRQPVLRPREPDPVDLLQVLLYRPDQRRLRRRP